MKKLFVLIVILSVPFLSWAQTIVCKTNDNGINYKNGVKQCLYYCTDGCTDSEVIGPGWKGDFGAFQCHGAIVQIQPSMNGQLSPNAVGFKSFKVSLSGISGYWSSFKYGELQDRLIEIYEHKSCRRQ